MNNRHRIHLVKGDRITFNVPAPFTLWQAIVAKILHKPIYATLDLRVEEINILVGKPMAHIDYLPTQAGYTFMRSSE